MRKIAVILYGPPGSGKGTQANLLERKLGLFHFDTGKFLESVVHDPKRQKDPVIRKERIAFDTGKLLTPRWILQIVRDEVRRLSKIGWGVVLSGSPRTMYEAEHLMPTMERFYGKKNIFVFRLVLQPKDSVKRNSNRLMCKVCGLPLLTAYYPSRMPKHCPVCGGSFYKRSLDNPATILVRLKEYRERTLPIIDFLKHRGYRVHLINGAPAPYQVFKKITQAIEKPR